MCSPWSALQSELLSSGPIVVLLCRVGNKQLAGDGRGQMTRVRLLAMIARYLLAVSVMGTVPLSAQIARPAVPGVIQAPINERPILKAQASGSQIYTCQQSKDGAF